MLQFDVIYRDYSACCEDFSRGIDYLKQRALARAISYFQRACDAVDDQHQYRNLYLCYYGYARILSGEYSSIDLCRHVARVTQDDADIYYILARAEWFCNNRKQMVRAISRGMKLDENHKGLSLMRKKTGYRKFTPVPFLSRKNLLNRSIGRLLRKK